MRDIKVVAFAVVAFLWLSGLAVAAGASLTDNVLTTLQIPEDWTTSLADIVTLIIAPFLAVTAIIYGLLTEMRIFRRAIGAWKINLIISICAVITSMYLGWFRAAVTFLLALVGVWGTTVFFGLFFIGSVAFVLIRVAGWRSEYGAENAINTLMNDVKQYDSRIAQMTEQYANEKDPRKRAKIEENLTKLKMERDNRAERIKGLRQMSG